MHLCYGYCQECGISASGFPGFIVIHRELREFRAHYNTTCIIFENKIAALETCLLTAVNGIPLKVLSIIAEKFTIDGRPMTCTQDDILH